MENNTFVWVSENVARMKSFDTMQDAQEYAQKMNEAWKGLHSDDEAPRWVIGTCDEYMAALEAYRQDVARREAAALAEKKQGFQSDLDEKVRRNMAEITAMEAIKPVCLKFDGKVLNKRFTSAMDEATGWYCHIGYDYKGLYLNGVSMNGFAYGNRPEVCVYKSNNYDAYGWDYVTGTRLNAAHAIEVIDKQIANRRDKIEELNAQRDQLDDFMQRAQEAARLLKELQAYPYELRQYCKQARLIDSSLNL